MNNLDYVLYYPMEDVLVMYSYDDNTLREDTFYGFEYGVQDLDFSIPFWDIDWDHIENIRHKVLLSDFSQEEFIIKFEKNENFFSFNYDEQYTVKDILEVVYENEFD